MGNCLLYLKNQYPAAVMKKTSFFLKDACSIESRGNGDGEKDTDAAGGGYLYKI